MTGIESAPNAPRPVGRTARSRSSETSEAPAVEGATRETARRRYRRRRAGGHGVLGFVLGYAVLHPVAMVVVRLLGGHPGVGWAGAAWRQVVESFSPGMVPMGLVFGALGLLVGAMDGWYRSVVRFQRDDLGQQLERNESIRRQLETVVDTLERTNCELRELEQARRRTTHFLVHDLKNHVGCVQGFATLLLRRAREGGWRPRDVDALERVDRQAGLMAEAVTNLLELARLEHRPALQLETVTASELLRRAAGAVAHPPDGGPDRTRLDADPALEVRCDPRLMTRVLSNLVHNAYRHNPAGVEVYLSATAGDGEVVLRCSDSGNGVPPELRDHLFDEFMSSEARTTGSPTYGLGLAFCKAAVEAHGGRIRCDSTPGEGAIFRVSLPCAAEEEPTRG